MGATGMRVTWKEMSRPCPVCGDIMHRNRSELVNNFMNRDACSDTCRAVRRAERVKATAEHKFGVGCLDDKACVQCGVTITLGKKSPRAYSKTTTCSFKCTREQNGTRALNAIKKRPLAEYWDLWGVSERLLHRAIISKKIS